MEIGVYEAKTHFASLIERASRGERITITKRGRAVAEIGPADHQNAEAARKAWGGLMANRERLRAQGACVSADEILSWVKEGRRE